jgi:hypothetical protein
MKEQGLNPVLPRRLVARCDGVPYIHWGGTRCGTDSSWKHPHDRGNL